MKVNKIYCGSNIYILDSFVFIMQLVNPLFRDTVITLCKLLFFCVFLIVCFTSYFMFSIAVLPHSPGVVFILSIVETRDQNSQGCPLLFSNLGSFCA